MSWTRFKDHYLHAADLGFSIDISRMDFSDDFLPSMETPIRNAFDAMEKLENGAIANPDENRMVGHYWLRDPDRAPTDDIRRAIRQNLEDIKTFVANIHGGHIEGSGGPFTDLLLIGIGGSALGPQFVSQALGHPDRDKLAIHFFDNTDPDGMRRVLARLNGNLGRTLCIVVSKSGSTPETRNGMIEAQTAYADSGLDFARHAIAITGEGSQLDRLAGKEGWLRRFPMWDWVGGRTSELAGVGLVPAALQGIDIRALLEGAAAMDRLTRNRETRRNPAALLALMWFHATGGRGEKDMVILPYKDRLALFSKYLQQLIMESLGKERDLDGKIVNQGIAVYGNKGSTDQHAYIQQLREGVNNFFVTFIEVLRDQEGQPVRVDGEFTSGDYLQGFLLGTRAALHENGRESITLTIREVTARSVGALIALYERAVGLYASLVHVNAYHQPGVEAGKKAASGVLALKKRVIDFLRSANEPLTCEQIAAGLGEETDPEPVFKLLEHLAANPDRNVERSGDDASPAAAYRMASSAK